MAVSAQKLKSSLYVGDLHPDVTENDLIEKFSCVAPLLSVHVCRDKFSHNSLCYGYVNFWVPCHALAAMEMLNHAPLKGKAMRIMWYEADPIARKSNNGNLFVKNLDKSITSLQLQEVFSKYGSVLSCKVAEENGISKGFGFIQFDSEDSATAARTALHDSLLEGKKLYVSKFLRKTERNGAEVGFKSLFVKNLDEDVIADVLTAKISEHGKVSNAVIMKDVKGKSKGFGFVNFDSHEEAKRAMMFLNGKQLGSKHIVVAKAVKKSEQRKNFRQMSGYTKASHMSVNNLDGPKMTEELFTGYGELIRRFNHMSLPSPYDTTLNPLSGANPTGRTLTVAVAKHKEQEALHKPFYAPNSQKSCSNFPYIASAFPFKPLTPYHYIASPSNSSYPTITQNIRGTFRSMPMKFAVMSGHKQGRYLEMPKDKTQLSPVMESSPVKNKLKQGCTLQPLAQDLEQKLGSDSRKVLKSPKMVGSAH